MRITLTGNNGSGRLDDEIESYSYSEDVTSLEPSELSGGTGQLTFVGPATSVNNLNGTHPNSKLMINNTVTLSDDVAGSVQARVRQLSVSDYVLSANADTLQSRLNVERTAEPHGGSLANLLTAIQYYCGLVDIFPTIDAELETELAAIPVNFIGWTGNVWEYLKMLCAGFSLSETENIGLEMYINVDELVFRKAKQLNANYDKLVESQTVAISAVDAAEKVKIFNYNTSYKTNGIVRDISDTASAMGYQVENVSIADSMQVDAGETITKRFTINATLTSVNQPVCVSTISPFPYTGETGQYVIVGNDNLPVSPSQWVALGGSLTVSLTENPNEIEITITAPPVPAIVHSSGSGDGIAPYKIGVEAADGVDYPAMYITGTGVFFDKQEVELLTGVSNEFTSKIEAPVIDNPFIVNASHLSIRGIAAAQKICGPSIQLSESIANTLQFGSTPGLMRSFESNDYRINSVQYSQGASEITAIAGTSISRFNTKWYGKSFQDFMNTAFDPATNPNNTLKFNEFTVIPLMEAI